MSRPPIALPKRSGLKPSGFEPFGSRPFGRRAGARRRTAAVLTAAALTLAACGDDVDTTSTAIDEAVNGTAAIDEAPAAASGDVLSPDVFDVAAQTINGEAFDLNELAGTDLILWFWAPW